VQAAKSLPRTSRVTYLVKKGQFQAATWLSLEQQCE